MLLHKVINCVDDLDFILPCPVFRLVWIHNGFLAEPMPAINICIRDEAPIILTYLGKEAATRRVLYSGPCNMYGISWLDWIDWHSRVSALLFALFTRSSPF